MGKWLIGIGIIGGALLLMKKHDDTTQYRQPDLTPEYLASPQASLVAQRQLARLGLSPDDAGFSAFAARANLTYDPNGMTDTAMIALLMALDAAYAATFH